MSIPSAATEQTSFLQQNFLIFAEERRADEEMQFTAGGTSVGPLQTMHASRSARQVLAQGCTVWCRVTAVFEYLAGQAAASARVR